MRKGLKEDEREGCLGVTDLMLKQKENYFCSFSAVHGSGSPLIDLEAIFSVTSRYLLTPLVCNEG
jgi:hypothetical protein